MNLGFLGKGNVSVPEPAREQIQAGAVGLKLHEDWGTTPAAIDNCLRVADEMDVQVAIHTDTLNESGLSGGHARGDRRAHDPHLPHRGCGRRPCAGHHQGGLAPQRPAEFHQSDAALHRQYHRRAPGHAHGLPSSGPGDCRGHRLRRVAHPPRDHRGRGHSARHRRVLDDVVGLAGDGPRGRGDHPHLADGAQDARAARRPERRRPGGNDNFRVKRYIAKYTINPAITHGIAHLVGSVEAGKLADLVLWKPAFFGVKPSLVIKGGMIAAAPMGDPNASIPTPQPVHYRPMFGAFGGALDKSLTFVSGASLQSGTIAKLGLRKRLEPVRATRAAAQSRHDPQRCAAPHRSGQRDLRGAGRRRIADLPARQQPADDAALFLVLAAQRRGRP